MATDNTSQDSSTQSDEFEALYAQTSRGMTYQDGQLTLTAISPTTLYFSDRPQRITGHIPTEEFYDTWGEGDDSFADNPPNAVLSIFAEAEVNDIVVVLKNPALDGNQMSYQIDILDGEMPASGGASSLFIDMVGRPMTPVSVAGVRRRGRRRGRRRARRR